MNAQITLITAKSLDKGEIKTNVESLEKLSIEIAQEFINAKDDGVLIFALESGSMLVVSGDIITGFIVKEV